MKDCTAKALLNTDMHISSLRPDEGLKFMEPKRLASQVAQLHRELRHLRQSTITQRRDDGSR
jgi:hypothetical protein